jgi:hypothetical protein
VYVTVGGAKGRSFGRKALPCLLALLFGAASLADRNVQELGSLADPARHMLNGALLHDMIQSGQVLHPERFAQQFYSHYPAISLPFHPPLFPLFEAVLYSVFGVDPAVARIAVAISVAASVLLLYAIVLEQNGSLALALLTTITFFSLRISREVASDVMLEFPALALTLAALYFLRGFDRNFSLRTAVLFAFLGAAAVWTKQVGVSLGAVPWLLALFTRRWHYFREAPMWLFSTIFGILSLLLVAIPVVVLGWTGMGGRTEKSADQLVQHHAAHYIILLQGRFFLGGLILLAVAVLWSALRIAQRRDGWLTDSFYLAWIVPFIGVPLVTPRWDERYILAAYPAMIALSYLALFRAAGWMLPRPWSWAPAGAAALFMCASGFAFRPLLIVSGVRPAARFVAGERPMRILYCGNLLEGNFLAQLRAANPSPPPTFIRADELAPGTLTPAGLNEFAHRFGIDYIVLEKTALMLGRDESVGLPTSKMELEKKFPILERPYFPEWSVYQFINRLTAFDPIDAHWRTLELAGWRAYELGIYRFTDPSPNPPSNFRLRSELLGRTLELETNGQ